MDSLKTPVRAGLETFLRSEIGSVQLEVEYDDLHGMWGGERLTVGGKGSVDQVLVRTEAPSLSSLPPDKVRDLVRLIVELEAWRQITLERQPVADESRKYLRISADDQESVVWERTAELAENNRLLQIRKFIHRFGV